MVGGNSTIKVIKIKVDDEYYSVSVQVTHDTNGLITGMNPEFSDIRNVAEKTGYAISDIVEITNKEVNSHFKIKA